MSKSFRKDLTGQRFGRLTVLEFVLTEGHRSFWKCQCECGNISVVNGMYLKTGRTQSCGCIQKEIAAQLKTKHNLHDTRLYKIWIDMKKRCYNPNQTHFKDYGGRGILVCGDWKDNFQAFYDWAMSNGYDDNLTIDRIDNNGIYEPSNCHWVDMKSQSRNTRRNVKIEYNGKKICIAEAVEHSKIPYNILYMRYQRGDRGERLFRPVKKKK